MELIVFNLCFCVQMSDRHLH